MEIGIWSPPTAPHPANRDAFAFASEPLQKKGFFQDSTPKSNFDNAARNRYDIPTDSIAVYEGKAFGSSYGERVWEFGERPVPPGVIRVAEGCFASRLLSSGSRGRKERMKVGIPREKSQSLFPSSVDSSAAVSKVPPRTGAIRAIFGSLAIRAGKAIDDFCSGLSQVTLAILAMAGALVVALVDYSTPLALSFTSFYLLPVMLVGWWSNRRAGLATGVFCTFAWMLTELAHPDRIPLGVVVWNAFFRFFIFAFLVLLLAHIRSLQRDLRQTLSRRTRQLDEETARRLAMERELALVSHREQQRIAHELHDGLGQELGALAFQAKLLAGKLGESDAALASDAERLVSILNASIARTRALSRLLDPLGTESGGLRTALGQLADDSGQAFMVACTFEAPPALPDFSAQVQLNLYRIAQEAIHNAVQHGRASVVMVRVVLGSESLTLEIADNGKGFPAQRARHTSRGGMGLRIMRHRSALLGAALNIASDHGAGCTVTCTLPLPPAVQLSLASAHA